MASKTTKTVVIVGSVVVAASIIGYLLWKVFKPGKPGDQNTNTNQSGSGSSTPTTTTGGGTTSGSTSGSTSGGSAGTGSPIEMLRANMGLPIKKENLTTLFNAGKNKVTFFTNGRFGIEDTASKTLIAKGSYENGGLALINDNGKRVDGGSVWKNLQAIIK